MENQDHDDQHKENDKVDADYKWIQIQSVVDTGDP